MSWFELYIITRLDGLVAFAIGMSIAGCLGVAIGSVIYGVTLSDYDSEYNKKNRENHQRTYFPMLKRGAIATAVFLSISLFVPSTKDVAIIHGLHWITNNEDMKQMPDDVARKLRLWLNDDDNKGDDK